VRIVSAPLFVVQKFSTDLTGDRNVLFQRYAAIHHHGENIGNANAVNVVLRDSVPANTSYVANSAA
jgi:hypothetical protein